MITTPFIVVSVILGMIAIAFHVLSVFLPRRISALFYYLNLGVHSLLLVSAFLAGCKIDGLLALFMASICLYTCLHLVKYKLDAKGSMELDDGEDKA